MKNVETKEGFIKLNKIKKKSTKIYKKDPQNRSLETEGLSEQKNVNPVMKIKQTAISQFSFFLLNLNLLLLPILI